MMLGSDGKIIGTVAGIALASLLGWAIVRKARPLWNDRNSGLRSALAALLAIAAAKFALLPFFPGYYNDVNNYRVWALDIAEQGPANAYPGFFVNYPPGYLYVIWFVGVLARLTGAAGEALRMMAESPPLVADFLLAASVFILVRGWGRSKRAAWLAMLAFALNPALIYDTLVWGQTDSALALPIFLSVVSALDSEYELSWALGALALLVKPQALLYLPMLGVWTLLRADFRKWWRSALAFAATVAVAIAPFRIERYFASVEVFANTSNNAFNFMALIGGFNVPDSDTIGGISFFTLGMLLSIPLFLAAAWLLWRRQSARNLLYAVFITTFGTFVFSTRMHERYFYTGLAVAIPLAVEEPAMLVALTALTAACLFNLIYAKHTLESSALFLATHDPFAKAASVVTLMVFIYALWNAFARDGEREPIARAPAFYGHAAIPWSRTDTIVLGALIVLALSRLWHLGYPSELFDEREFTAQARAWMGGQSYFDSQPPLGVELIALSIRIFGDYLWSSRLPMAAAGIALVGITYLLGRRMLGSRTAAAIAAAFVLCDGLFIVQSRVSSPEIVFVTSAALSYLLLFRFVQSNDAAARRRTIAGIGLALGLCLASRLYIPIAVLILVMGTLIPVSMAPVSIAQRAASLERRNLTGGRIAFGALILTGSIALLVYLLAFLPNYLLRQWGGLAALWQYFQHAGYFDQFNGVRQDPRASPWWSWPIALSPVTYWRQTFDDGQIGVVVAGGNPVLWFGALGAIVITAVRLLSRASLAGAFLVVGYLGLWIAWFPIAGNLFLYDFMPSLYLGYLALAAILAESWLGKLRRWEQAALMLALGVPLVLMLGAVPGTIGFLVLAAVWTAMTLRSGYAGKFVSVSFLVSALIAFAWFLPARLGLPISADGYQARAVVEQPAPPTWW
jgi:Gpi18-like mannosyltransferase